MRIAILNWRDIAHPDSGGAEVFFHEVGSRWVQRGHDVHMVTSHRRGIAPSDFDGGVRITRVGSLRSGAHHLLAPDEALGTRPDVILESINTVPYMLPLRRGLPPFVPLVHQMAVDVWDSHLPRVLAAGARRAEPQLLRPYRTIPTLAVSESTKRDLVRAGLTSVSVIPQGGLGPQVALEKTPFPTFMFVGRLTPNKRPADALEAFRSLRAEFPQARLWVVGDGKLRDRLSASLPPGAELLGRLGRSELLTRMSRAHLLLMTSVREGWGLVVTEAAALGTPTVAYDVPGLRDSVRHGKSGLLTDARARELAAAAANLMRRPEEYQRLRTNAIEWGSRLCWDVTAGAIFENLEGRLPAAPVAHQE